MSFRKLNAPDLVDKVAEGKKYVNGEEIGSPHNSFLLRGAYGFMVPISDVLSYHSGGDAQRVCRRSPADS
jgi:hypothetical protein